MVRPISNGETYKNVVKLTFFKGFVARPADRRGLRGGLARARREFADKFNTMPRYVVSLTLRDPEWTNSTVLFGDVVAEVTNLKAEQDGDIVVHGRAQLVQSLIENASSMSSGSWSSRSCSAPASGCSARPLTGSGCSCRHQPWSVTASPSRSTRTPEPVETWRRAAERRVADQNADHRLGSGGHRVAEGGTASEDTLDRLAV